MANELQTKLDAILEDKNTNLLPEHLKAGVTCLGVEGEFEGGAQINNQDITINKSGTYTADEGYTGLGTVVANFSGGDTKTFATVEDMYADENPIPDGKALIYRKQKSYIEQNTNFTDIWLPETITLPRAVTSDIQIKVSIEHEHGGGGDSPTITPTGVTFMFYMNMSMAYFEYVSTDGITYTRTTADVSNEDMGWGDYFDWTDDVLTIKSDGEYSDGYHCSYAVVSGDEDLAKEFYTRMAYGYYGLYVNTGVLDNTKVKMVKNIKLNTHSSDDKYDWSFDCISSYDTVHSDVKAVVTAVRTLWKVSWCLVEKITDTVYRAYSCTYTSSNTQRGESCHPLCLYRIDGSLNCHVGFTWSSSNTSIPSLKTYEVDISTNKITDISNSISVKSFTTSDGTVYYVEDSMDPTHYFARVYYGDNQSNTDLEANIPSSTDIIGYTGWFISMGFGKSYAYKPAQTQFTLNNPNQLLPKVCALGVDGEYTGDGSIYSVISINNYLEQKDVDLREGVIYLTPNGYNGVENTKATKNYLALRYMQCKKIENAIKDFYQVITTDKYNVWFNPINKILDICDATNNVLYEYTNEKLLEYDNFKYRLVGNVLYVYTFSGLLLKFGNALDTVSVIAELNYYTDDVILTDTCAYAFVKSSSTVINVNKILYDGTSSTLTSWTRAGGDVSSDNQLIIKDNILYGTYSTINSNYGYLCMIDITNDTVIKSTAYSLQGWIITNSEDKSLIFIQYANNNANMYSIGTDGTLTSVGTLPYGIYNDTLDNLYYIPYANTICGFSTKAGVYVATDSAGTNISTFSIRQFIAGTSDTSLGGTVIPGNVICEDNIIKCDFMYYNYTLKQNYSGTITIDMNHIFTTEKNTLFPIDTESLANNIYRKIQLFTPAIGTEYENTISPAEYEEINTMAEDVLGGVE